MWMIEKKMKSVSLVLIESIVLSEFRLWPRDPGKNPHLAKILEGSSPKF